jgi:hypothetical protein
MGAPHIQSAITEHFSAQLHTFSGEIVPSDQIKKVNLHGQKIAILGVDQFIASHLLGLTQHCTEVLVFQIQPQLILPQSSRLSSTLIPHPLISKNKRLFSNHFKRVLALRFLEREVSNLWLRKLLTANAAQPQKCFLKSDTYFQALQKDNCQLITWPISHFEDTTIHTINDEVFKINALVVGF